MMRKRTWLLVLLLIASISLFAIYNKKTVGTLLKLPAHKLVQRERLKNADAVVVLLGGQRVDRTDFAATVIQRGFAKKIYLCDGYKTATLESYVTSDHRWIPMGQRYAKQLVTKGVKPEQIILTACPDIYDTSSELKKIYERLKVDGIKDVILVTSAAHSRRVGFIWERRSSDIRGVVVGAKDPKLDSWWKNIEKAKTVLYEYGALGKEFFRRIIGDTN